MSRSTPASPGSLASKATLDCLSKLISFDTTSCNSNLALIEWAAQELETAGARLHYTYNSDRTKANLFATFGAGDGGIVLSGHSDVVPVDGQDWRSDPFVAQIRDGRVYGRGACDMKGFIAVVLSQAEAFGRADLREPLHVALSYDEEVGCLGVPALLADIAQAGFRPSGCIVGEPTGMRLIGAHKGGRIYRCHVRGCAAHSSLTPRGVNAIEYASRLIAHIQDLAEREEIRGCHDDGFDVPFSTISTNTIVGGTARNIIPADCEFDFDYRFLPGTSPDLFIASLEEYAREVVLPKMRRKNSQASIEFECLGAIPALDAQERDAIFRLAAALLGHTRAEKVAYGTEASFFQAAGVPSVVCGPGSIEQAHKPDEYVTLEQLAACERFVARLVERLSR
ncbi:MULTISPECIES: acetylornithine deacetylase [Paraburkholderia]|uniref:acetylornithine deacetylase n=1 Tax=Paraburkholderia TaxID=1822464 RepID=UPI002253067F|nr:MULTISPECIES: acetylornithine deacetylase [Paraburkholderia]MCX4154508.1 acetylornithine deacetylase [Paraburkholderia aspalathi]MDN7163923.1 acetylornithine deacetylase [Paraburkholderia sp. SECH2]MDQ6392408.1 acetylornithine deacetylase [Paraburkholderia aspalathi]